jgi:hypothetical protein
VEEHLAGVAPAQMVAEEFKNIQEAVQRGDDSPGIFVALAGRECPDS